MKLSVKQFSSLSILDGMKKYKDVCDWILELKSAKEIEIDCGDIIYLSIDPKSRSIKASDKDGNSKNYKIKWDIQNVYFTLTMLSMTFQKDETLTSDERSTYFMEKLKGIINKDKDES